MDNQTIIEKKNSDNPTTFSELKSLVNKTVKDDLKWYKDSTFKNFLAHRGLGSLVILLSASLPLITILKFETIDKNILISVIGVSIAFMSGIKSFYRFGEVYITNMRAMVELKNYVSDWELAMIQAERNQNTDEGFKAAVKATRTLLLNRDLIDRKNNDDYSQLHNVAEKKELV